MKVLKACLILGAFSCALAFSGCATVTRGRTEQLSVVSEPTGASVRLSNGNTGVTPATFTVPRKGDIYVTVFKDGYETAGLVIPAKLSSTGTVGFLGNALIGGVIGGGIDIYSGATLSHEPNPVVFRLVPRQPKPPAPVATMAPPVPATGEVEPAKVAAPPVSAPPSSATPPPVDSPPVSSPAPAAPSAPPAIESPAVPPATDTSASAPTLSTPPATSQPGEVIPDNKPASAGVDADKK